MSNTEFDTRDIYDRRRQYVSTVGNEKSMLDTDENENDNDDNGDTAAEEEREEFFDHGIIEAKKVNLSCEATLNKSIGQLFAQMLDAIKTSSVLDKRKNNETDRAIKGILTTGQAWMFFKLRHCKSDDIKTMEFCGKVSIKLPNQLTKVHPHHSQLLILAIIIVKLLVELLTKAKENKDQSSQNNA